jgi:hypothetical protein
MKKILLGLATVASMAAFTSCDNTVLTASLAENAMKKDQFWENPVLLSQFKVGYYEVDATEIKQLQQLQAAGMITFTAEQAIEARREYSWRSGYYYEYIDHFFANVALTEEGQKYVFTDEIKKGRKDIAEDLNLDAKPEAVPEYMTTYPEVKFTLLKPDPRVGSKTTDEEPVAEPLYKDESYFEIDDEPIDAPNEPSAYSKAKAKVNEETVSVIIGEYDIVKAKEVYCPEEYVKVGKGECKVVIEFADKTPFGFVLGSPAEGSRDIKKIELKRYEDLGWVVEE